MDIIEIVIDRFNDFGLHMYRPNSRNRVYKVCYNHRCVGEMLFGDGSLSYRSVNLNITYVDYIDFDINAIIEHFISEGQS